MRRERKERQGKRGEEELGCVDTLWNNNLNRRRACQKTRSRIMLVIEKLRQRGGLHSKVSLKK